MPVWFRKVISGIKIKYPNQKWLDNKDVASVIESAIPSDPSSESLIKIYKSISKKVEWSEGKWASGDWDCSVHTL